MSTTKEKEEKILEMFQWALEEAESNLGLHTGGENEYWFREQIQESQEALNALRSCVSDYGLERLNQLDVANQVLEMQRYSEEDKKKVFELNQKLSLVWQELFAIGCKYKPSTQDDTTT